MSMDSFFTRSKANQGKKVPLYLPDGSLSEHWLNVLSIDSDAFREAEVSGKRKAIELAEIKDVQERAEAVRTLELEAIAALITGWSFEQECNRDNVVNFLREAPQIADMVNRFAARRSAFYEQTSENCTSGQKQK